MEQLSLEMINVKNGSMFLQPTMQLFTSWQTTHPLFDGFTQSQSKIMLNMIFFLLLQM